MLACYFCRNDNTYIIYPRCLIVTHVRIQRGQGFGPGRPPSLKNHKNIGFLSNTGPDPLKNHKAAKPAFNNGQSLARQRNAI